MKRLFIFLLLIFLIGCSNEAGSLDLRMDKAIENALKTKLHPNKYKDKYISYYVEPSIGRIESSSTSHVFDYNGEKFVMNVDVANIINESLFEVNDNNTNNNIFLKKEGIFYNLDNRVETFVFDVYKANDTYLLILNTNYLNFYSYTDSIDCANIAEEMLKIARTIVIDKQSVINDFNIKEVITYRPSYLDLFEEKVPENGSVEELIKDEDILNEIEKGNDVDN